MSTTRMPSPSRRRQRLGSNTDGYGTQPTRNLLAAAPAEAPCQSPNQVIPPTPSSALRAFRSHMGLEVSIEEQAEQLAHRLQHATDVLIERLFAYLSQLPEEDDEDEEDEKLDPSSNAQSRDSSGGGGGMTLPASAIGWLSSQYFPPECHEDEVCPTVWSSVALKDRLRLLRFLLPRVTHLRIIRQVWPPELPKQQRKRSNRRRPASHEAADGSRPRNSPQPPEELNCSVMSVDSAITVEDPGSSGSPPPLAQPTPETFWNYIYTLQNQPTLDMRVFPRVQVLVLESIPPTWISHFSHLRNTLQVLRWNRACLFGYLPRLFQTLPQTTEETVGPSDSTDATTPKLTQALPQQSRFHSKPVVYPRFTHLILSHCGIGERSGLRQTLSNCLPHLECLSLPHNDLVSQKVALHGLRHATQLKKLNLSHNALTALPKANISLGGQLQRLQLSYNHLETIAGLDRLYGLEELWLDHNRLGELSDLARLCQLPQLRVLHLEGNRSLEQEHPQYLKQVWTWFLQYRMATTPRELPACNGRTITPEQWNILMHELIPMAITGGNLALPSRCPRVQRRKDTKRRAARIDTKPQFHAQASKNVLSRRTRFTKSRPQRKKLSDTKINVVADAKPPAEEAKRSVAFSVSDVLVSLHQQQTPEETEENIEDEPSIEKSSFPSIETPETRLVSDQNAKSDLQRGVFPADDENVPSFPLGDKIVDYDADEFEGTAGMTSATVAKEIQSTADEQGFLFTLKPTGEFEDAISATGKTPKLTNGGKNKIVTLHLQTGANKMFDVMTAEWDVIVEKVAGGLIPDGKPRMPMPDLTPVNQRDDGAFSSEATDLLSPENSEAIAQHPRPASISGETASDELREGQSAISSMDFRSNTLPDQIYPDDSSVPSSLGTNREDFPSQASKFQIAEENAAYDGPDAFASRNVLEDLKLYFETYVFPPSLSSGTVNDGDDDDVDEDFGDGWQTVALRYPRIQLWPEDRRWLESSPSNMNSTSRGSAHDTDDWATRHRERFIRVWDEEVVPCGKPALRRLSPNRRNRLGFHGDQLYTASGPDPYAECRKVYLCLSSAAFYIILRSDDVTKKQDEKGIKKRFPNPIPDASTFEDAPWPHAVVRHTYQELQSITIGFEFQRLTLQFSNPTVRKTEPYVYMLLTSNKKTSVSLLQEIQRLTKEAKRETIDLNSDAAPVAIENDSQLVLDAIQAAITPEVLGTIMHYQIVQQRWKHGEERGTVRRVCIVTDSKLFLMDEDYHADSHKTFDSPLIGVAAMKKKKNKVDFADASYRKVDEAFLTQVVEVQAAGADPKAITIVIAPLSRLSRTHRWRLVCRDNVGAERLVDDVRKAMELAEE